ncbi:MAG: phosphomannomutase/phosphoglucomutase [Deferribacterota bacterium]|nr:phosphomannomutase/phosphoglucomutase [Deferribacterota bacterium]
MVQKEIFRQYDIRGVVPTTLSKDVAKEIANRFAYIISERINNDNLTISVGRDVRLSSTELFEGIKEGLLDAGCNIVDLGICPTPVTYFSSFVLNVDGFIMITGSHNPPEYNGLKLGIGKTTIYGDEIINVYNKIIEENYKVAEKRGQISSYDIVSKYIEWVVNHFRDIKRKVSSLERDVKVVIDAGNGVASSIAPKIFKELKVNTVELYCEEDGHFPNHHPDPTVRENLKDLINKVLEVKADFGVAYDGDADRIGVVSNSGNIIWGDMLLLVYAKELLKHYDKPTVIADVKASQVLFDELEKMGIKGIMWKTGHSLIKDKLKEIQAELAGEMSGHIFFADRYFGYDDAIYSSVRFLEVYVNALTSKEIEKCDDLFKDLPQVYNTPEIRIDCPEEKKFNIVEEAKNIFKEYKSDEKYKIRDIIDIDGIRVIFDNGWGLLRASNTQPVIVMRFEAKDKNSLERYRNLFENILNKLINE